MGLIARVLRLFVGHADDGAPERLPSPDELVLLARRMARSTRNSSASCWQRRGSTRW
jgi:hypothetical protein